MKYIGTVVMGCLSFLLVYLLISLGTQLEKSKPSVHTIKYHHPKITSASDIYQIPMSESVSDVCFDGRLKKIVVIEGAMILQQCELDSNRWHFNIKIK